MFVQAYIRRLNYSNISLIYLQITKGNIFKVQNKNIIYFYMEIRNFTFMWLAALPVIHIREF